MAEKKFYLTVYRVEILSEEPIASTASLSDVMVEALAGKYSMRTEQTEQEILNGAATDKILSTHGNPGFFDESEAV